MVRNKAKNRCQVVFSLCTIFALHVIQTIGQSQVGLQVQKWNQIQSLSCRMDKEVLCLQNTQVKFHLGLAGGWTLQNQFLNVTDLLFKAGERSTM